jgi:putative endopeptidase
MICPPTSVRAILISMEFQTTPRQRNGAPIPQLLLATMVCLSTAVVSPSIWATPQVSACNDFDEYVNGAWRSVTELPPNRARVGSFDTLAQANARLLDAALKELVADPARQSSPGLKLLADYYRSGMDEAAIERQGLGAVHPLLERIAKLDRQGLPVLLGDLARLGVASPLAFFVGIDAKDATRHVLSLSQAGLGLPDRDDYAKTDPTTVRIKAAYRQHATVLLTTANGKASSADAASAQAAIDLLMAFEGQLAEASMTLVQRRDPNAIYNPVTVDSLQTDAPGLNWNALLATYTARQDIADGKTPIVLGQPAFARAVARLVKDAPMTVWRDYLRVRLLDTIAPHGPKHLAQSHFDYTQKAQRGLQARPPRIEEVIQHIGGRTGGQPLGQTLGELFTAKAFSPHAKSRALQMVDDIRAGMRQRVKTSPWMSSATQVVALEKLDAMSTKIGAPSQWKTYDGLKLSPDDYLGNLLKVSAWSTEDRLPDLQRPVDRTRWNTSPHIVNAFAASGNQIVFPAGILQPPFFDAGADDASNFGAIGMVIGHEITHHFDDRGRQFDALGNLRDWWLPADVAAYRARADRVVNIYSGFEPLPGEPINGRQTLGENLSDVGGMQIAYAGLQIALERQKKAGTPAPLIDGHTPEQRFFMANAIVWRIKWRNEALINQIRTGQHSPGRWRILGPMSNMQAFAQAFSCKPDDAMASKDPIIVW